VKQEQAELQRAKSSPNLSQSGDSGIESSSGSSQGDVTIHVSPHLQEYGNTNFNTSEYAEPNVEMNPSVNKDSLSLGAAYAATDIHPNQEYLHQKSNSLFDLRQYARGYIGPVPSLTRKPLLEPRTYSQGSNRNIPPAPSHSPPPPPPPGRKMNTEIVKIQTANKSDAIYMNVEELKRDGYNNIQSSFKPSNGATFHTPLAYQPDLIQRRPVSDNIYANPEALQMERNASRAETEVTYAEVHLEDDKRPDHNVPPPPSEPPPASPQEKQGVTFADVKIYDNAAKFIQNNPNSMILLTDAANTVPSEDKKRVKLCRDSSTEDEDEHGRKLLSKNLPYFLPEPDYDVDMTDNTMKSPPKEKTNPEMRSSSLPPLPPAPLHDAPKPQSVRKPLTLEEQLRMSGRRRMLHSSGHGRALNRSRSGSTSSTESQKPMETITVNNTQIHMNKPGPQLGESDIKAAVAMRQARLSYRSEVKSTDDGKAAVGMRQARTAYRTETKTPDSGMEATILKNEFNKSPKQGQKFKESNIPAPPPFMPHNMPPPPEFKPQNVPPPPAFGMKPERPPKEVKPPAPEKPTTNDLLAAIAQRKAKLAASKAESSLENIEKKIAENKQTGKFEGHDDHLRMAVLRRREQLANKSGDDLVQDIEQKIRNSQQMSRGSIDFTTNNAQKVETPKPTEKTVINEDENVPGSPVITAPPNSPQKAPPIVVDSSDAAHKVTKITVSLRKPLMEQINDHKQSVEVAKDGGDSQIGRTNVTVKSNQTPVTEVTAGVQKPMMVSVKPTLSATVNSVQKDAAKQSGEKARRGIPQKSDMLGLTAENSEVKSDGAADLVQDEKNDNPTPKVESFTQRAERLRQEWLQRRRSSSSIDIASGSDDDTAQSIGASSNDPVKSGLEKEMFDIVKGESGGTEESKTSKTKPKRFVLKMDSSGKAKYVQESKVTKPDGETGVQKQTEPGSNNMNSYEKLDFNRLNPEPRTQSVNESNILILPPPNDGSNNDLSDLGPVLPPSNFDSVPPPTSFSNVPPPDFSSHIDDGSDVGFIPPPSEYSLQHHHEDDSSIVSSMSTLSTSSSVEPRMDTLLSYLSGDRVRVENDYTRGPNEQWHKIQNEINVTDKFSPSYNAGDIYEELYAPPPPGFVDQDDGPIYEEVGEATIPPPVEFNSQPQSKNTEIVQNQINSALSDKSNAKTFRDKLIHDWTLNDVSSWLESLTLADYKNSFQQHEIDGNCLVHMGRSDFMDIGVTRVGHRLTMERAIKKVQLQQDTAGAPKPQIIASF
jgi:hypothetical protein